ncbi:hypothetical protein [Massilia pseudoviolaceinigra]|uniref:hypothetical protein n=1 Tax=Massilia pseudoviolaceinigra TaxID=3057165 RepID=UPI002796B41E|nr:hypothetical protein [Massilia sp. CCM 9206]MDQ1921300.1 hypothetical protein [Massilia sp. CCM 9206]
MSALGTLAAGVTGGIWKIAAIVLAALLLMVLSAAGTGWWAIASARDQALADLHAEQAITAQLRTAIQAQNDAVEEAGTAKLLAEARGQAAQQQAAAAGRRFDAALAKVAGARATTCDEAMPAVNVILDAIK